MDWLAATGMQRMTDPTVLQAFGQRWLLAHGDALCLDDVDYQRFRQQVRPYPAGGRGHQQCSARLAIAAGAGRVGRSGGRVGTSAGHNAQRAPSSAPARASHPRTG